MAVGLKQIPITFGKKPAAFNSSKSNHCVGRRCVEENKNPEFTE